MIKICYLGDDGQRHVNWRQKEGIVSVPQVYYLGNTAYFPIYSRFYYVLLLRTFCVLVGGGEGTNNNVANPEGFLLKVTKLMIQEIYLLWIVSHFVLSLSLLPFVEML